MGQDIGPAKGPSRRGLLAGATGVAAMPLAANAKPAVEAARARTSSRMEVEFTVNGHARKLALDPRTTLLDALREHLDLTGSKKGCDHGQCGACTVHVDGRRVLACLTLAASIQGRQVTTIEGLGHGGELHPMQSAFIEHDAFQCGYCTPGQIMSAIACVQEGHAGSDQAVREQMSGNLCRCAAYPKIVAAVRDAAGKMGRG